MFFFFFFNDTATTEIYTSVHTLSLHDALPISTPARWDGHRSAAVRRMTWLTGSPRGRRLMRAAGVRLPGMWDRPESPEDLVGKIAPVPLLIVHGRDDHFFDEEEAWR